jgi:Integrase
MSIAGRMVVDRNFHGGYQSKADIAQRWGYFCKWVADEHGVKKMENLTPEHVIAYGRHLQSQLDAGERTSSSAPKNYVSAVNTVLRLATNGKWKPVRPGRDCGIQPRSYVATESKAMTQYTHESAKRVVGEKITCLLDLQRAFGLRFKESCLLNPTLALREALKHGQITLTAGTKGGKRRTIPCRPCGVAALERAIAVQDGRSMIPKNLSYVEFRTECYEQAKLAKIGFHSERHHYAQERYTEITGAPSPVHAGWLRRERLEKLANYLAVSVEEAKKIDTSARLQISIELGHNRESISNVYIG